MIFIVLANINLVFHAIFMVVSKDELSFKKFGLVALLNFGKKFSGFLLAFFLMKKIRRGLKEEKKKSFTVQGLKIIIIKKS